MHEIRKAEGQVRTTVDFLLCVFKIRPLCFRSTLLADSTLSDSVEEHRYVSSKDAHATTVLEHINFPSLRYFCIAIASLLHQKNQSLASRAVSHRTLYLFYFLYSPRRKIQILRVSLSI